MRRLIFFLALSALACGDDDRPGMDASVLDSSFDSMVSDASVDSAPIDAGALDVGAADASDSVDAAADVLPELDAGHSEDASDAAIEGECVVPTDCDARDTIVCFGANLLERDYTCVAGTCVEERTTTSCFFTRDECSLDGNAREVISGFCNAAEPACEERVNVMSCSLGCDPETTMCRPAE